MKGRTDECLRYRDALHFVVLQGKAFKGREVLVISIRSYVCAYVVARNGCITLNVAASQSASLRPSTYTASYPVQLNF